MQVLDVCFPGALRWQMFEMDFVLRFLVYGVASRTERSFGIPVPCCLLSLDEGFPDCSRRLLRVIVIIIILDKVHLTNLVILREKTVHIDGDPRDQRGHRSVVPELQRVLGPHNVDHLGMYLPEPHEGHLIHVTNCETVPARRHSRAVHRHARGGDEMFSDMGHQSLEKLTITFPTLLLK